MDIMAPFVRFQAVSISDFRHAARPARQH